MKLMPLALAPQSAGVRGGIEALVARAGGGGGGDAGGGVEGVREGRG
ncbi:MAG: hypothetical protein ACOY0T_22555 [Myxococcota bacterium]